MRLDDNGLERRFELFKTVRLRVGLEEPRAGVFSELPVLIHGHSGVVNGSRGEIRVR